MAEQGEVTAEQKHTGVTIGQSLEGGMHLCRIFSTVHRLPESYQKHKLDKTGIKRQYDHAIVLSLNLWKDRSTGASRRTLKRKEIISHHAFKEENENNEGKRDARQISHMQLK